MSVLLELSRLQSVDVRSCWKHEALDFTPWLAEAENMTLLSETVGMDLELVGTEQSVGGFNADILCRDNASGEFVLIENQLEGTDHSHLGQLLTYTAGLQARRIIWVARRFREEHRAALDWLNENTIPEVRFYGLEIQLWRIGDNGPVAPKFNVICQPNTFSKAVTAKKEAENGGKTDASYRLLYWTAMFDHLKENPFPPLKLTAPQDQNWAYFSVGRSNFGINPVISHQKKIVRVELYISGPHAKYYFHELQKQQAEIEQVTGPLQWEELPGRRDCRIAIYLQDANPLDETLWAEQHNWILKNAQKFDMAFRSRIDSKVLPAPPASLQNGTSEMVDIAEMEQDADQG